MAHIDAGRIFVGCEGDELGLGPAVRLLGSTPFFFSSDFPHEVTEETCREEIEELHEQPDLSAADVAAILYGNAERLYRFPRRQRRQPSGYRHARAGVSSTVPSARS